MQSPQHVTRTFPIEVTHHIPRAGRLTRMPALPPIDGAQDGHRVSRT